MNATTITANRIHAATIAIVLFAAAAAVAAFALTSTATAGSTYNSSLGKARPVAEKVASSKTAAYTSRTARARAKARAAKLAKARRAAAARRARLAMASTAAATAPATSGASEAAQAQALLDSLIAQHPILAGTTVEFGDTRGYQAIAYYQGGRIIISPAHTASLDRIMNHEVWHIIDWRDNGRIDWGENVPPR